ncbi:MAG: type II toxin-antitoxin system RelE/ParE family toxin [Burkholderiales bacterium]
MTRYEVLLTAGAERDLEEIYDYIAEYDSVVRADHVLERLVKVAQSLSTFPKRGVHPRELLSLGIREYRQSLFKPYRVVYRIIDQRVFVYMIVDWRRNMQALLARRLLE